MAAEKQHIRSKIILEILGKPKEHVETTIRQYVKKIDTDTDLIILKKDFAEAKEQEGMWSAFVELELVVKGITKLIGFCFDYMPSSIEILKPDNLNMDSNSVADFLNDLQARLHSLDMAIKQQKAENDFLKRNMHSSIKNLIFLVLAQSKGIDKKKLSKITGINEKELEIFLNNLIEEKLIKKEDNIYSLAKNE